jgi:hypothetical protein
VTSEPIGGGTRRSAPLRVAHAAADEEAPAAREFDLERAHLSSELAQAWLMADDHGFGVEMGLQLSSASLRPV